MDTREAAGYMLIYVSRGWWALGLMVTMAPTFYRFEDWQMPRLILAALGLFGSAMLCRIEAAALTRVSLKMDGREIARSVSTHMLDALRRHGV
jgi:hypothetical protein